MYTGVLPEGAQSMTLMYWVKFNHVDDSSGVYQTSGVHDGHDHRFYLGLRYGNKLIGGLGRDTDYADSTVNAGEWTHLAMTYDSEAREMRLYVNGQLNNSETYIDFDGVSARMLLLGAVNGETNPINFQDAQLDDVQIWSRALTDSEIGEHMLNAP
ncbi:LamG domain-containing protein, partial [Vibrio parahaemolyticus]|nr:LamG domain-containing protein [Vibrio parahaemolyticus]